MQLGEVQSARKAYEEALMLIQKQLTSDVHKLDTSVLRKVEDLRLSCFLNLAQCHLKTADYSAAAETASKALEIDPVNCKALYRRGVARLKQGFLEEAKADLLKARLGKAFFFHFVGMHFFYFLQF